MLVAGYEFEIFTPPCDPGAERYSAKAHLRVDIRAVLPYLNATLPGARYQPEAPALTWRQAGHGIVFHPFEIAVSNLTDRTGARQTLDGLVALVNRTWEERHAIEPDETPYRRPTPMAVNRLLPGTNCRQCGEPTCFTFALKLITGAQTVAACTPLSEPAHATTRAELAEMLGSR